MRLSPFPTSLLLLAALACGGGNTATSASPTVTVRLTDSPFTDAKAVLVTFSEVSAHRTGEDFMRIPFSPESASRTCDLKKLVGATDVLGTGALPSGHYTQIRLTVVSAALFWDNPSSGGACAAAIAAPAGRSSAVEIPSGEVKLNREFDVGTMGAATITLDFDGDRSIHETGNGRFMMQPVIAVSSVQ
jgi:hypothetical protein